MPRILTRLHIASETNIVTHASIPFALASGRNLARTACGWRVPMHTQGTVSRTCPWHNRCAAFGAGLYLLPNAVTDCLKQSQSYLIWGAPVVIDTDVSDSSGRD